MRYCAILLLMVLAASSATPPVWAAEAPVTYVVRSGDTLSQIGLRYGVSIQTLTSANPLSDPSHLVPGQILKIPRAGSRGGLPQAHSAASHSTPTTLIAVYWVRWGDTLYGIASRFRLSADDIKLANGLWTDIIVPGQRLEIPTRGSVAALAQRHIPLPQPIPVPSVAFDRTVKPGSQAERIVREARRYVGIPYVWGGASPRGMDCSGLIYLVFSRFVPTLGRMRSEDYYRFAKAVEATAILPGDLVFFTTDSPGPSHVGIFIGDGKFLHASSTGSTVTITSLDDPHYGPGFLGVRRLVSLR